jgi:hypothetical protein
MPNTLKCWSIREQALGGDAQGLHRGAARDMLDRAGARKLRDELAKIEGEVLSHIRVLLQYACDVCALCEFCLIFCPQLARVVDSLWRSAVSSPTEDTRANGSGKVKKCTEGSHVCHSTDSRTIEPGVSTTRNDDVLHHAPKIWMLFPRQDICREGEFASSQAYSLDIGYLEDLNAMIMQIVYILYGASLQRFSRKFSR